MKSINYDKWNKYEIGNVPWVNSRKDHISRKTFINYIIKGNYKNILEIGAGEAIEAQEIIKRKPDINYTIMDVSDTFLDYVKSLGINGIKGEMHNTQFKDKEFDIVYLASVIEHSPNLILTFRELRRISKEFFITMFKWRMKGKDELKSRFIERRKFYSTVFNIDSLFNLIKKHGVINHKTISTKKGKIIFYDDYIKKLKPSIDEHRNGNNLSIIGKFK